MNSRSESHFVGLLRQAGPAPEPVPLTLESSHADEPIDEAGRVRRYSPAEPVAALLDLVIDFVPIAVPFQPVNQSRETRLEPANTLVGLAQLYPNL